MAGKRILKLGVIVFTLFFALFVVGKESLFNFDDLKAETDPYPFKFKPGDYASPSQLVIYSVDENGQPTLLGYGYGTCNIGSKAETMDCTSLETMDNTAKTSYTGLFHTQIENALRASTDNWFKHNFDINDKEKWPSARVLHEEDAKQFIGAYTGSFQSFDNAFSKSIPSYMNLHFLTNLPDGDMVGYSCGGNRCSRISVGKKGSWTLALQVGVTRKLITDISFDSYDKTGSSFMAEDSSSENGKAVGTFTYEPSIAVPSATFTIDQGKEYFSINENNEVVINIDNITAGTYSFTIKSTQASSELDAPEEFTSVPYTITINDPYKKITDLTYTPDAGKDPLKLDSNTSAGQIGTISASYDTGSESGRGIRYALTNTKANDNAGFSLTTDGKLSIVSDLTVAKTYNIEVTAYETEIVDGKRVDVKGKSYTKTFQLVVKDKDPEITGITFTPNYPNGKAGWNFGDAGIQSAGEVTGTFSFAGGTSGTVDETTKKDYQKWEIVDAGGNVTTDTNFELIDNELKAKGKIPVGSYTLRVMVTDLNGKTFTKEITIEVAKTSNSFDWVAAVKNTASLYYGDTLSLDLTGVEENATITYGPSLYVKNGIFTAYNPTKNQEITASASETSSYGATVIKHTLEVKKRPLSVKTQLQDASGNWQDSLTIKQGQSLPSKQVVEDTSDPNSKGLVNTENSVDHPIVGSVTYEYRQGNTKVKNPSEKAGTYQLYAIYGTSKYYDVSVTKVATLIVSEPDKIDDANKQQFYEFQLADGSTPDITKWQKEDIIIHPKHTTYTQMKVNDGSYQAGNQTYSTEGSNTVALSFKDASGATTTAINETLKIDKTNPTIDKIEFSENNVAQSAGNGTFKYLFKNIADIEITASDAQSGIEKYTLKVTKLNADGTIDSTQTPVVNDIPSTATTLTTSITQQGMYQVEITVSDASGRISSVDTATIKIKNTQTTLEVKGYVNSDITKPYDGKTWTKQPIQVKLNASDASELTNPSMSTDGTNFIPMAKDEMIIPNTTSINGTTYYFKAVDIDGDEISASIKIYIDVDDPSAPTITWRDKDQNIVQNFLRAISFDSLFSKEVQASFTSTDMPSGIDSYSYTITELDKDGNVVGSPITGQAASYDLKKNKNYKVEVIAYDKAGNKSAVTTKTVQIDTEAPVIYGVKDQNEYKQYYLPRYISVVDMPVNGSGLKSATYTKGNDAAQDISDTVKIMDTGDYQVYAEDHAGNIVRISFRIVPLPKLDDIDGTDESKAIIDQVQKELDEIKDKIDDTEKKNFDKWIQDATEKWNSLRKKVVEDEETTSKIEGQGEITFDPKVELIVDKLKENDVPVLPRKALYAYDVYLMKNNTVIQPDGSVKVYLPYDEKEAPIVYQIDENGSVKEIMATKENGYVTFTTDTLLKYAISNTAQEVTKPSEEGNTCVAGPDGIAGTKDDICGEGNGDKEPEKKPDGSVQVPDGGTIVFPDGNEIDTPNGGIIKPDGSVELPDGTKYDPEGNVIPDDTTKPKECKLNGKVINVDSDKDGLPDLNLDIDKDCIADLNLDVDSDGIADIDIDIDGDGKADINMDIDKDGKADLNLALIKKWIPNKNDCVYQGFSYDTMADIKPYLNVDDDGDGEPDRNIDDDGDGTPDRNIDADWFEKYGTPTPVNTNFNESEGTGGVLTGDHTKWTIWWIVLLVTGAAMSYQMFKKHHKAKQ